LLGSNNEGENTPSDVDSSITQSIEREIEQAISDIKSGKHPELQQNLEALERVKQKRLKRVIDIAKCKLRILIGGAC
jgi:hypothetical protein